MLPRAYLDHNATAPLRAEARQAMLSWLERGGGNPSSVHAEGRAARAALEDARRGLAQALGAQAGDVIWTGSATEANNLALKGAAQGPAGRERRRVCASAASHPSALEPVRWLDEHLADRGGFALPVDAAGRVERTGLRERLGADTLLVSVIAANNETGVVEELDALAPIVHEAGAWLHVDASQCLGRVAFDVESCQADLVTLSAHKAGGPPGIGALWVRPGVRIAPLVHGGHQERNRRGGTEGVLAAVGFAAAARAAVNELAAEGPRQRALIERLWAGIHRELPDAVRVTGPGETLPNTLLTAYPGADGETLLMGLDLEGVAASSGSACTAGSLEPSHVLLAMGIDESVAQATLRFSVGPETTDADIERALSVVPQVVRRARGAS